MQWLQDPKKSNVDNQKHVRRAASRHFRNKKIEYLKAEIEQLETNIKSKSIRNLCRSISNFKKGYRPSMNTLKDKKGDLVTDSHSILSRWRSRFSQILNVLYMVLMMLGRQKYIQQSH